MGEAFTAVCGAGERERERWMEEGEGKNKITCMRVKNGTSFRNRQPSAYVWPSEQPPPIHGCNVAKQCYSSAFGWAQSYRNNRIRILSCFDSSSSNYHSQFHSHFGRRSTQMGLAGGFSVALARSVNSSSHTTCPKPNASTIVCHCAI